MMRLALVGLGFSLAVAACAHKAVTPIEPPAPRPIAEYTLSKEQDGVVMAVEPLLDAKASRRLFGMDLPAMKIVPVYVVVRNAGETPVLVQKSAFRFAIGGRSEFHSRGNVPPPSAAEQVGRVVVTTVLHGALLGFLEGQAALAELPDLRRQDANDRLMYNELPDRTVASGQTVFGFVYVPVDRATFLKSGGTLHVNISTMPPSDESRHFDFDFNMYDTRGGQP